MTVSRHPNNQGVSLSQWRYTATGGETTLSGTDGFATALAYTVGAEQLFVNGVLLERGVDYVATTGTTVTGLTALVAGDIVTVSSPSSFSVANAISKTTVTAKGDLLAATGSGTVTNLPVGADGTTLVANSASATGVAWAGPTFAAGKNKIINGDFGIWQRGTSAALTNNTFAFGPDRFRAYVTFSAGTTTFAQQTFTPGTAPVAGYEGQYFARLTCGSTSTYAEISQKIENVQTYAGQTATFSFWAKASASIAFTPYLIQQFGSGGSGDVATAGSNVTLTTSWARYTTTLSVPSISGKTIGTGSCLLALMAYASGTLNSATIDIWGWQAEASNTATAFQTATGTLQGELAACQRYFYTPLNTTTDGIGGSPFLGMGWASSTTTAYILCSFPVTMRAIPSYTYSYASSSLSITTASYGITTVTSLGADQIMQRNAILSFSASGGGLVAGNAAGVRHDGAGTYIAQFSAEL